ncbi:MAG: hypothetical protein KIT19_10035 [Phycisphaeraceae bacterium]|nr:hypothetical protein [Phycisphaeraceae bacterium]
MNNRRVITAIWLAAACGLALPALAQNQQGRRAPEAARPDQPPVLEGPRADRPKPPGVGGDFGGGERMGKDRIARRPAPMRSFFSAIQVLDREDTPDALRLSEQQHEQIESIMSEQRRQMRAQIESQVRERASNAQGRGPGDRPAQQPGPRAQRNAPPDGERPANADGPRRERPQPGPQAGREGGPDQRAEGEPKGPPQQRPARPAADGADAPRPARGPNPELEQRLRAQADEMQTRLWSVLNDAQRVIVRQELDRIEAEGMDADLDRRVEQYLNKRREGANQGGPAPERSGPGARMSPEAREEMARRLSEMSPEERREAAEKMRTRMQRERTRGEPKPPPSIDDLRDPE